MIVPTVQTNILRKSQRIYKLKTNADCGIIKQTKGFTMADDILTLNANNEMAVRIVETTGDNPAEGYNDVYAPAANQAQIEAFTGYPNFGGTGTVTWHWRS